MREETIQEQIFQPSGSNILIIVPKVAEKTEAGIIKPDSQIAEEEKKIDIYLTVVAKGPNTEFVNVGDKVLIRPCQLNAFNVADVRCAIIHESSVLGKKWSD